MMYDVIKSGNTGKIHSTNNVADSNIEVSIFYHASFVKVKANMLE